LLTFFNNYPFYKLIENGKIFLAQPPLYRISKGTKNIYIKDDKELESFIIKSSKKSNKINKDSSKYKGFIDNEKSKMSIQRFKGLGEMNPEELWSTTLNPETRTLLKVEYSKQTKVKSKDDQKLIQTLMGNDVAPRKDFIISRALDVSNLDI
jgi:DNA gyrase subunit B